MHDNNMVCCACRLLWWLFPWCCLLCFHFCHHTFQQCLVVIVACAAATLSCCAIHIAGKPTAGTKQQQSKAAGPSPAAAGAGTAGPAGAGGLWRLSDILARPDEFRRVLSREVLSGKQLVMAGVVMLEAPVDALHLQVSRIPAELYGCRAKPTYACIACCQGRTVTPCKLNISTHPTMQAA